MSVSSKSLRVRDWSNMSYVREKLGWAGELKKMGRKCWLKGEGRRVLV